MLLAALLSATNAAITTDSGTYNTTNDLSASQAVSTKVKEIVSLLDGTQAGINSAKAKYLDGYGVDAGNLKTLAGDVCSTCTGVTTCASVKAVYPSVSCFLTDYIQGASSIIDDTSLNVEARSQWFRVAIQDGIPVQLAISYMEKATASHWDKAAAVLLGTDADRSYTVYGRADGLARDYGTLAGGDSDHYNALHSKANEKILTALEAGRTGGAGAYATQAANVIAQLKVIYAQATLRSTWGVEENLVAGTSHDKNQARGLAYFGFVLVPYVKELDTVHEKHADMISDFFDIGFSPESFDRKEYCRVLDAMEDTLNEHSANLYADFGALTAAAAVTCPATYIPGRLNLVTDAGSYWPLSDVAGSLSYSTAMKDIEAMTDEAAIESQYAAIKTEYQKKGLRAEATKDRAGEPVWDMFKTQTGSGTWITDFLDSALDGTIPGVRSNDARRELVEKTAKDAASVQAVISDLYKATTATPGTDPSVDRYWDHGAAKYVGNTLDRGSTIYGRADKRGKNFEAVDGSDVAFTNIVVLRALEVGRDATTTQERKAQYDTHHREADSGHLRAVCAALRASHRRSPALRLQARGSAKVPSGGTRVLEHHIPVAPGEGGEPHRLGADQGLGPRRRPREGRPRVLPRLRADRDVGTARVGDGHARRRRGRDVRRGSADRGYQAADRAAARRRRRRREQQATRRARRQSRQLLHRHVLRVRVWLLGLLEGAPGEAGYGQAHTERGRGTDGDGGGDGRRAQALSE